MSTTETVTEAPRLASGPGPAEPTAVNAAATTAQPPPQIQVTGKTKDGRPLRIRAPPQYDNLEDERLYRKQHLAAAFRVFADRGFDEGVAGHISVRDPILTDHFCKSTTLLLYAAQALNRTALPQG